MHRDYNSTKHCQLFKFKCLVWSDNHEVWCFDGFVLLPLTVQQLTVQLREESKREREREKREERKRGKE